MTEVRLESLSGGIAPGEDPIFGSVHVTRRNSNFAPWPKQDLMSVPCKMSHFTVEMWPFANGPQERPKFVSSRPVSNITEIRTPLPFWARMSVTQSPGVIGIMGFHKQWPLDLYLVGILEVLGYSVLFHYWGRFADYHLTVLEGIGGTHSSLMCAFRLLWIAGRPEQATAGISSGFLGTRSLSAGKNASAQFLQQNRRGSQTAAHRGVVVMTSQFEKTNPYADELKRTAAFISQPGKGILASDESNATTGKRYVFSTFLRNADLFPCHVERCSVYFTAMREMLKCS